MNPLERLQKLQDLLEVEIEKINIDRRINNKVKKQMERAQKEYYLNEKIKAIHQELGRKDDKSDELEELKQKIESAGMPKDVKEKALAELKRLEAMPNVSAEATVSRNYIDWLVNVPWKKSSRESKDIKNAEKVLNEDHYGLEKVKERILEFLAVRQLVTETKGSILCFAGPPASARRRSRSRSPGRMNRKFVRLSLGGVRDEAEVRGHRRTYIGAFPGQIIQQMKKAGTVNPVFLLDEVDKMSMDFRGDPSSALLEVLDPEQNHAFVDHYLDVEYDLSKVMFIATANVVHPIPPALKDRMEIISLSGYTPNEKLAIARQFLVPKQVKENGLTAEQARLRRLGALRPHREVHPRGGRAEPRARDRLGLPEDRPQGRRRGAKDEAKGPITVTAENLSDFLGKPKHRPAKKGEKAEVGLSTGLAWTEAGGDVLHIETTLMRGKGNLVLTGQLGDVMQESARAALSYVRSRAEMYGADPDFYEKKDIHVHIPEGAIPKDGPSAGITMATSILSAVTNIACRKDLAMTGEITLRGKVLPVGGIKEKLLAAYRAGITTHHPSPREREGPRRPPRRDPDRPRVPPRRRRRRGGAAGARNRARRGPAQGRPGRGRDDPLLGPRALTRRAAPAREPPGPASLSFKALMTRKESPVSRTPKSARAGRREQSARTDRPARAPRPHGGRAAARPPAAVRRRPRPVERRQVEPPERRPRDEGRPRFADARAGRRRSTGTGSTTPFTSSTAPATATRRRPASRATASPGRSRSS